MPESFYQPKLNEKQLKLQKLIEKRESKANMALMQFLVLLVVVCIGLWMLFAAGVFIVDQKLRNVTIFSIIIILLGCILIVYFKKGKGKWIKYLLISALILSIFYLNILTGYRIWIAFLIPLLVSVRYYSVRVSTYTWMLACFSILLSAYTNVFFSLAQNYVFDLNTVSFPGGFLLQSDSAWLWDAIEFQQVNTAVMLRATLYLVTFPGIVVESVALFFAISLIKYSQEIMLEIEQVAEENKKMELEVSENRMKVMVSQIQPHFLYNTLSAIMAIDGNPDETVDAIGEFGKYLRENLDTFSSDHMVLFSKELQHVKRYVSLEQLRFGDKIKVIYDTETESFQVPALSVQMLVENAVKHGVSKTLKGGTICISSRETENEYIVLVTDDGIGFDKEEVLGKAGHVGITNIENRMETFCGGRLVIESKKGEGTKASLLIPKRKEMNER